MKTSGHELMRHALGVQFFSSDRWSKPYRNYFVAGGSDEAVWRDLVTKGLAVLLREGSERTGGCPVYVVTDAGREAALAGLTFKRRWGYGRPVTP